jgi:hypothetical protein
VTHRLAELVACLAYLAGLWGAAAIHYAIRVVGEQVLDSSADMRGVVEEAQLETDLGEELYFLVEVVHRDTAAVAAVVVVVAAAAAAAGTPREEALVDNFAAACLASHRDIKEVGFVYWDVLDTSVHV